AGKPEMAPARARFFTFPRLHHRSYPLESSGGTASLGLRRMQIAFLDLIEQRLVADLQQGCGFLAMPVRLFESMGDGCRFSFPFHATSQALQSPYIGPTRHQRRQVPIAPLIDLEFRDRQ